MDAFKTKRRVGRGSQLAALTTLVAVLAIVGGTMVGRFQANAQPPGLPPPRVGDLPIGRAYSIADISMDVSSTCVRLLLDNLNTSTTDRPLTAAITYFVADTMNPRNSRFHTTYFKLAATVNGIFHVPLNTDVWITFPERPMAQWFGPDQKPIAPCKSGIPCVNLASPPSPAPAREQPFTGCYTTSVRLKPADVSGNDVQFLNHFDTTLTSAVTYYPSIDKGLKFDAARQLWSGGTHSTLRDFWRNAGFRADGTLPPGTDTAHGAHAALMNYNDLALGEDVYMLAKPSGDVFAYMTLYGQPTQDLGIVNNADLAANAAKTGSKAGSRYTLAMEYVGGAVNFWVYGPGGATAKLVNTANLDALGEKPVPGLCRNCHGESDTNAPSFLPFYPESLRYPGGTLTSDLARNIISMNHLVFTTNPTPGIQNYLRGNVHTGWQDSPQTVKLLDQVVGKSCRSCHLALQTGVSFSTYDKSDSSGGFKGWAGYFGVVCGGDPNYPKQMPHSLMAYRSFWLDTDPDPDRAGSVIYRPDALVSLMGGDWARPVPCQ